MGMLWRGSHKFRGHVGFQGGTSGIVNIGAGTTFWVDNTNGSDSASGTDPNHPLATIQAAIDLCTDWEHDYVFVMRKATSDHTIPTGTSILMNKHTVHLIGVANGTPQGALIRLVQYGSETVNIIEFPQDTGYHCEVAGFGLAGGSTTKAGLAVTGSGGGATGGWVHHCNFGGLLTKGTPGYGILADSGEFQAWTIEDCTFYGSGNNAKGLIGVDGINWINQGGSAACKHSIIRNNIFMGIPGVAINMGAVSGVMIIGNQFALDAETSGAAITLAAGALGCFCTWNDSQFGSTNAMTNGGFRDLAAGDANVWASNWNAGAIVYPASS